MITRVGVVSNPRSERNASGTMHSLRRLLRQRPDVLHAELGAIQELPGVLADFAARDVDLVVVNGGDGSVVAALTSLLNDRPFRRIPPLSILPSGMTNLIAKDVGISGKPEGVLARLFSAVEAGRGVQVRRPVLTVTGATPAPLHGMLLGAGAFHAATLLARNRVHTLGLKRSMAVATAMALFLLKTVGWTGQLASMYPGAAMRIEMDGVSAPTRRYFVFVATTLGGLSLGLRPFWGGGGRPIRYTMVGFPPQRLLRALVPLLRGRPRPWMAEAGYTSGTSDRIAVALDSPMVLDGEIFEPQAGVPVVLTAEHTVSFLRG